MSYDTLRRAIIGVIAGGFSFIVLVIILCAVVPGSIRAFRRRRLNRELNIIWRRNHEEPDDVELLPTISYEQAVQNVVAAICQPSTAHSGRPAARVSHSSSLHEPTRLSEG